MRLFIPAVISFFALALLHLWGMNGLYHSVSFYDKILHFLFGVAVSALTLLFLRARRNSYFILTFLTTIFIGSIWELFELFWNFILVPRLNFSLIPIGLSDTFFDLFWMIIGSLAVMIYFKNFAEIAKK